MLLQTEHAIKRVVDYKYIKTNELFVIRTITLRNKND